MIGKGGALLVQNTRCNLVEDQLHKPPSLGSPVIAGAPCAARIGNPSRDCRLPNLSHAFSLDGLPRQASAPVVAAAAVRGSAKQPSSQAAKQPRQPMQAQAFWRLGSREHRHAPCCGVGGSARRACAFQAYPPQIPHPFLAYRQTTSPTCELACLSGPHGHIRRLPRVGQANVTPMTWKKGQG